MTIHQDGFPDLTDSGEVILRKGLEKIGRALSHDGDIEGGTLDNGTRDGTFTVWMMNSLRRQTQ
jgi:hypothetical protein